MPTVPCKCGRDVWYDATTATSVVCPHCERRVDLPVSVRRAGTDPSSTVATDLRFPISLWLLVALAAVLLPAWIRGEMAYHDTADQTVVALFGSVFRATLSPWLLIAFGLLLSVRVRELNLSVWGCAALGAVVCWALVAAGLPVPLALIPVVGVGAGAAIVITMICRRWEWPVWLVAGTVGSAGLLASRLWASGLTPLDAHRLGAAGIIVGAPITYVVAYLLPIVIVVVVHAHLRAKARDRDTRSLRLAIFMGCCLSTAAGAAMLLAAGRYHPSGWLVGDLRVLSAVVLCGGWIWRGRGGLGLACVLLPLALLVSTMWMETIGVWLPGIRGTLPVLMLTVMAGASQFVSRGRGRRMLRRAAGLMTAAGTVIVALGTYWPVESVALHLAMSGVAVCLAGLILGLHRLYVRRDQQD